jgi:transcription elongation factor Elf1
MLEKFFTCPYCWETISMILDESDESSDYIEDCEVCCRPIELRIHFEDEKLTSFCAMKMQGI